MSTPLFAVRNLEKHYPITEGVLDAEVGRTRAVDGISFTVDPGETFGIVGESGCGKSTAATAMLRIEEPTGGEIAFEGENVGAYDTAELRSFRREAQMIFQDPESSFDPRMSVGEAVAEPLVVQGMTDRERREGIVADLLERVGLSAEDSQRYPHEFSGGQKQRLALARALTVNPKLLVADEPVSALDVSVQSEILRLLDQFQNRLGLAVVLISHDLSVVREICDRVAVMYLGEFVEVGPTAELFANPKHPYTRALLSAIPTPDPTDRGLGTELTGTVPNPAAPPSGCRFHTRCPELVQPEGIDLDQDVWLSVADFHQRLRDGLLDTAAIRERALVEHETIDSDAGLDEVPDGLVHDVVRREYDLPGRLGDPRAEETLRAALDSIAADDLDGARDALGDLFVSPCERETPPLEQQAPDHEAACHLLDGE